MTLAIVDCPTGLAGNMLLAALLDLGLPQSVLDAPLGSLGLADRYRLRLEERRSGGLRGLHLDVESQEADPPHRAWGSLQPLIETAPLMPELRQRVLAVFRLLAEAEATVHGVPLERVHFHELGALDTLVDVVGVCAGLLHLGVERLVCGPPPAGHGSVRTAHGLLPLPAPAVLEIARVAGIPLASSAGFPEGELTTPTGIALMACWADGFGPPPASRPLRIGIGLGSRTLDRPNLLRLRLAEAVGGAGPAQRGEGAAAAATAAQEAGLNGIDPACPGEIREPLLIQQAQIDDATPEELAFLAEALRQAGALEVFSTPITMKKGRLGSLITALLPPALALELRQVWWRHSPTLGVRQTLQERWTLPRHPAMVATPLGSVRLKWNRLPDGRRRVKPEADDLEALARRHGLGLDQVRQAVAQALADAQDRGLKDAAADAAPVIGPTPPADPEARGSAP